MKMKMIDTIRVQRVLLIGCIVLTFGAVQARNELSEYTGGSQRLSDAFGLSGHTTADKKESTNEKVVEEKAVHEKAKAALDNNDQSNFADNLQEKDTKKKESIGNVSFEEFTSRAPLEEVQAEKKVVTNAELERSIELNFEDADLQSLVTQIEDIFDVTFITDDAIDPLPKEASGKILKGNKISFKTQKPLSKQEAWNLFVTFLDLAGFAITSTGQPRLYRIKSSIGTTEKPSPAARSPLASYIGVSPDKLPASDEIIRYIYFAKNSNMDTIQNVIDPLRSPASTINILKEVRAFILTDKAYNVRSLLEIVREIDKATMPQSMSVLKLRQARAEEVRSLYEDLIKKDDPGYIRPHSITQRKQATSLYFPENATIIAEPRSNALIILGPEDVIQRIEHFITKYVDVDLDQPYSPLFVYPVKYADAITIANVMSEMVNLGKNEKVGQVGGVRGGDKYFKSITFTPEQATNQLIIKGDYEDYKRALEIIEKLDEPQPQVAIEVLLLSIDVKKAKQLGVQMRSKIPGADGLLGKNVNFQTSGIRLGRDVGSSIIPKRGDDVTTGAKRLLGNLLDTIMNPSIAGVGTTVLNFGVDDCGVWGIFNILESMSSTEVLSNPFLVAVNNTPAIVSVGQVRRVVTSTVVTGAAGRNTEGFGDFDAKLNLKIIPQINSDGMIVLEVTIENDEFIGTDGDNTTAAKTTRVIDTKTTLADQEVLAIGGLMQNRVSDGMSKVPILGDIPVFGWLFKNKAKSQDKSNIIALISVHIVKPKEEKALEEFTKRHKDNYSDTVRHMHYEDDAKDPVARLFFKEKDGSTDKRLDNFIFERANMKTPENPQEDSKVAAARKKRTARAKRRERRKRRRMIRSQRQKKAPIKDPVSKKELRAEEEMPTENPIVKKRSMRKTGKKNSMLNIFSEGSGERV